MTSDELKNQDLSTNTTNASTSSDPSDEVAVQIQGTPNPHAWKFILDRPVLSDGKASYGRPEEALGNTLALELLNVEGVKHIHFFENVITLTSRFDVDPIQVQDQALAVIQTHLPAHNPDWGVDLSRKAFRASLPPERQRIEEILDLTIRPGLRGDGGDLEVVEYTLDKKLMVRYEGACGTCPSATSGTLMAIEGILREEFDPEIEVIPV